MSRQQSTLSIARREGPHAQDGAAANGGRGGAPRRIVQSAARALHLFHQLIRTPDGRQLAEISRECSLSEVTTFRLLQTFLSEGLVRKDPERGRYRLSPLFWLTVIAACPDMGEAQRRLRNVLPELAQRTGAFVTLAVPYVGMRTMGLVSTAIPVGAVRLPGLATANAPMHALAAGKCYLASLSEEDLQEWLRQPLAAVTPCTISEAPALLEELRQVRSRGFALDRQEHALGVCSLAVCVRDGTGAPAAALQLSAAAAGFSAANVQAWLPPLQQVAQNLSELCSALARLPS